jgi:hypothetical protein
MIQRHCHFGAGDFGHVTNHIRHGQEFPQQQLPSGMNTIGFDFVNGMFALTDADLASPAFN